MPLMFTCSVCGQITPNRQCPDHQPVEAGSHWSPNRRRQSQRKFATAVLLRDGNRCRRCGSTEGLRAAHWPIPLRSFAPGDEGAYDPRNGLTLCRSCDRKLDPYAR